MFRPDTDEEMNPMPMEPMTKTASPIDLKSYLTDLYKKKNLGDEQRSALESSIDQSRPGAGLTFLASLGAGLAGQNQGQAVDMLNRGVRDKEKALADFDSKRKGVFDELKQDREIGKFERENKDELVASDPESENSRVMQSLASKMMPGRDFSKASAKQLLAVMPSLKSVYDQEIDAARRKDELDVRKSEIGIRREDLKTQRDIKAAEKEEAKAEKKKILDDKLTTPFGRALTEKDATDLKEATIAKSKFDAGLQEMIDLRTKHGGGAIWNRTDVDRGKKLSKALLLEYKNLVKLGVLSGSDVDIVNTIIPEDPLAYDMIPGQDPILSNMEKFKQDSNRDFETQLNTRIAPENRITPAASAPASKTISDQDRQALEWAKSNPNDPRAAEIRKRLGE